MKSYYELNTESDPQLIDVVLSLLLKHNCLQPRFMS